MSAVEITGSGFEKQIDKIDNMISASIGNSMYIISAFTSNKGIRLSDEILKKNDVTNIRFITGLNHYLTHPNALELASELDWNTHIYHDPGILFHPKVLVLGSGFAGDDTLIDPSFSYVGSSNLTLSGLNTNIECGVFSIEETVLLQSSQISQQLWQLSNPLTEAQFDEYAKKYATISRMRRFFDLEVFGVVDEIEKVKKTYNELLIGENPEGVTLNPNYSTMAWAGLESFTGEYTLQVEFPRDAGRILNRILVNVMENEHVNLRCSDEQYRRMKYAYYEDNGMFRLNIPNDVPMVDWVRENKKGAAVVQCVSEDPPIYELILLPPGDILTEMLQKCVTFGSWGKTTTRLYGWI